MTSGRYSVLLIAEAANPEWTSVPLVGWRIASAMADVADVHLVTHIRNKAAIERASDHRFQSVTYIDNEAVMRPAWWIAERLSGGTGRGWTILTAVQSLLYPTFERMIWKRFRSQIEGGQFDVVHRVTPLSPTVPSLLATKCRKIGVPFVLGPLNGGIPWPKGFSAERHREREWLSYIRGLYKLLPAIGRTYRHAATIIAASLHTKNEISRFGNNQIVYLPENGINSSFIVDDRSYDDAKIGACFIGRLVPLKCVDVAIDGSLSSIRDGKLDLTIIGDGPLFAELSEQVDRADVAGSVRLTGWLEHAKVPEAVRNCQIFLFPSVKEFGGGAVIEALSLGLVPLVIDYGGPAEIVANGTGFKVPMGTKAEIAEAIGKVLATVIEDRAVLERMARAGRERAVSLYTWSAKASQILEVYRAAVDREDVRKLDFGFGV